jgi:hypothetical protein
MFTDRSVLCALLAGARDEGSEPMTTITLGLFLVAFALAAARQLRHHHRREQRIQSRLIRLLHGETGRSGAQLFRPRAQVAGGGVLLGARRG